MAARRSMRLIKEQLKLIEEEMATFERVRVDLSKTALGKWVLIKHDRVLGLFDTEMDAVKQGYRELGYVPFLVQKVSVFDEPIPMFSHLLDL